MYHGMILVVALLWKVLVIVAPFVATCTLAGEGLASREKAGVADLLLLNVDGTWENSSYTLIGGGQHGFLPVGFYIVGCQDLLGPYQVTL